MVPYLDSTYTVGTPNLDYENTYTTSGESTQIEWNIIYSYNDDEVIEPVKKIPKPIYPSIIPNIPRKLTRWASKLAFVPYPRPDS